MLSTSTDDLLVDVCVNLLKRNGTLIIGQRPEVKLEPRPRLCCWLHVIACITVMNARRSTIAPGDPKGELMRSTPPRFLKECVDS
jgi:hypothetical protein